jgi:hypothetical protein
MSNFTSRVVRRARRIRRMRQGTPAGPGTSPQAPSANRQIKELSARVSELEVEVIETRQMARRIAELTDVVEQLLLPEDVRDAKRLEERLGQVRARH